MFGKPKQVVEEVTGASRSQEHRCFHADDMALRAAGFVIVSRPRRGPILWRWGHTIFKQIEAVELVKEQEAARGE